MIDRMFRAWGWVSVGMLLVVIYVCFFGVSTQKTQTIFIDPTFGQEERLTPDGYEMLMPDDCGKPLYAEAMEVPRWPRWPK